MMDMLIGAALGVLIGFLVEAYTAMKREKEIIDIVTTGYISPIPVRRAKEQTIKDWFAKLDEEGTEFKAEVLSSYSLTENPSDYLKSTNSERIAEEAADICTIVTSMQDRMRINQQGRDAAQLRVNQHNKERNRF